jgi:O-antigen/teichoic acid export membrane protein
MFTHIENLFNRFIKNSLIRRILLNSSYLFSATGLSSGMGFVQSILAGRLLGPAAFGVLGALTNFTSNLNKLASFRMQELVIRYVGHYQESDEPQRAAAVFKVAGFLEILGSLVAFVLIWVLAPVGARIFAHDPTLVDWFRIYGFIVLANFMFETSTGILHIFDRFRTVAIINVLQSVLTLTLIAIAFFTEAGLPAVVSAYMAGKVFGSLGITVTAIRQASKSWGRNLWRTPVKTLETELRTLLTFAFSTNISGTVSLIAKDSEVLWVSAFLGTQSAGYYKTALALSGLLQLPISPLPKVTFPELTREIARKNWDNVRYVLKQGSRLAAAYSVPVTLGLVFFGKILINLTYGPDFLPTYEPLIILLGGFTFMNIFYWNRVALLSLARPVFPTIVNIFGMVMKVAFIFLLVPKYGYIAFAVLLSGYYIFTVGLAALRVFIDLRSRGRAPTKI